MALAISASLLGATAVAVHASSRAYRINQEQSLLMQRCRLAMNRMLTEIRTSHAHSPLDSSVIDEFAAGQAVVDCGIQMYEPDGTFHAYRYDASARRLETQRNGEWHTLLNGVDAFTVTMQPMRSANSLKTGGGYDLLQRASITLTVRTTAETSEASETTGRQTVSLSSSVTPRANAW